MAWSRRLAYLAQRGTPTTLEELEEHERVLFMPTPRFQCWTLTDGESTYEFGRPARFTSNNLGAVRTAALAGAGIATMTDFFVAQDLAAGTLVRVMPAWRGTGVTAHLVYQAREKLPPRLALFLDHLARAFDPVPWATTR